MKALADCGRARWKIENEHNNVLKNHGYNLEHNFGHGKAHGSENFCGLNLLAFLFHTVLYLGDEVYQRSREWRNNVRRRGRLPVNIHTCLAVTASGTGTGGTGSNVV